MQSTSDSPNDKTEPNQQPDNQGVTYNSESWEGTIDYMPPMLGRLITEEEIEFLRKPRDYPFPPN